MISRFMRRYGVLIAVLSFLLGFFWEPPADWQPGYSYGESQSLGVR